MIFAKHTAATPDRLVRRVWLVCATCFTLFAGAVQAGEITPQTLRYQVDFRGNDAGQLEIIISRDQQGYLVRSISHLSTLASLFLESHTIESRYQLADGRLRLVSGQEILNTTGEVTRSFEIDYAGTTITFSTGESIRFNADSIIDADGFPLILVAEGFDVVGQREFISINPKRARSYTTRVGEVEQLEVAGNSIETTRIDQLRADDPERLFRLWMRHQIPQVPVRIVTGREGKLTTIELVE